MKRKDQDKKDLLGKKLRAGREAAGLSQCELAEKIKASSSSIVRWEQGENAPQERTLKEIARVCGIPFGALAFTGERTTKTRGSEGFSIRAELAKRLRLLRGPLTQREFARKIGVTARAYLRYEGGARNLRDFQIRAICEACGVSADWLLFGTRGSEGKAPKLRG